MNDYMHVLVHIHRYMYIINIYTSKQANKHKWTSKRRDMENGKKNKYNGLIIH